jgi:anaphase-promoting complex subunit 8
MSQNLRLVEHAESERVFEKIRLLDPGRTDGLDIYSNILYLTGNRLKLSNLAHDLLAIDKDRPEVCCVVGGNLFLWNRRASDPLR